MSYRLPLLLRTGGGWLTLLWGELRQLLLLQRVKDERTSGDLKMQQKDTKHTHKKKQQKNQRRDRRAGVRIRDGLERSQAETGKKCTRGQKQRETGELTTQSNKHKVTGPFITTEFARSWSLHALCSEVEEWRDVRRTVELCTNTQLIVIPDVETQGPGVAMCQTDTVKSACRQLAVIQAHCCRVLPAGGSVVSAQHCCSGQKEFLQNK